MTTPVSGSGSYIALPVTTDPDQLAADAIAYLAAQTPGYVAREGHLEVWMLRAAARMAAEVAGVAAQVPLAIFQYLGQSLLGLPPLAGAAAAMSTTWTMTDSLGHTIPAGTTVAYRASSNALIMFRTTADVVVPAGQTATTAGQVTVQAADIGAAGNGFPTGALVLVDNLAFVSSVTSTTASTGGADAEDQAAYLDRLSSELQLLSPRPILPGDFAALARNQAYVGRATALDGYNPANGSSGNPRMVAVAATDPAGQPLTSGQATSLSAALQAQREVNFVVNVVAPTYTTVNIAAQIVARRGANTQTVTDAATAALTAFLSPATWGGDAKTWDNAPTVRLLAVGGILAQIPGVGYVTGVQIGIGAGALQPVDGQLPGAVPLPNPGAINVTVQASA